LKISFNLKTDKSIEYKKISLFKIFKYIFAKRVLEDIYTKVKIKKQAKIEFDYNDLIINLNTALINNTKLVKHLRTAYKVALVDEFQDTDYYQWEIFKKIFISKTWEISKIKNNLILIGDPKQSIYRFRRADLNTYYKAKNEMDAVYKLSVNFRSGRKLLDALNLIFKKIFSDKNNNKIKIEYYNARYGGKDSKAKSFIEPSPGTPVEFIDIRKLFPEKMPINLNEARKKYYNYIAKKIALILGCEKYQLKGKDGTLRGVSPKDIAVLVEKNNDGKIIQNYLFNSNIPASLSKDQFIFESDEMLDFLYLFDALKSPNNMTKR